MNTVDLQHLPFSAYSLIEASAGTGKTYTISQLVLRLVLLGQSSEKPLAVSEILVVTFTKAATQELKDRIRANLVTALEQIKTWKHAGLIEGASVLKKAQLPSELKHCQQDPLLAIIIDGLCLHSTGYCQTLLQHAIFSMDEAPIFTIHSFCQRMLGEYALLAKQPLQQTLVEQIKPSLITLAQQFWREKVYGLDKSQTTVLLTQFKTPRDLVDKLSAFLSHELLVDNRFDDFSSYQQACDQANAQFTQAKNYWLNDQSEIRALFDSKGLGASYKSNHLTARFDALNHYLIDGNGLTGLLGGLKKNKVAYFFQSVLDEKCSKPLSHPIFELLDQIQLEQELIKLGFIVLCRRSLVESLDRYKTDNNLCFFDDLISGLVQALDANNPSSEVLANTIRARFPVALIDEFQDTDKQQFTIFDAIYQRSEETALMMIGDPKQAIYSFRGADIQTYFSARNCVDKQQQYTLDVNWRSLPALVSAVNTVFKHNTSAFVQDGFPEYPWVNSPAAFNDWQGLCLSDQQGVQSSFAVSVLNQFELQLNKTEGTAFVAKQTAEFLSELLSKGSRINGKVIQPRDIAILVRKGGQAKAMQKALLAQGLNSIFLSKETVLECDEVPAFIRLIKACANPFDTSLTLAALGDELIAYSLDDIQQLNSDPTALFKIQDSFSEAKALAHSKGFIVMWQWLLNRFNIATSLLTQRHGERRLTNINQLAEVAHGLTPTYDLEQQLQSFIDLYLQCTEGDGEDGASQKMRLDTEANLIEIVTIHGSKGLEYPMVCCPFVSESDEVRKGFNKLYNSKKSAYEIVWNADDKQAKQLAKDQLAEDIRLLYVAFTRAKYHLNISWQPFKGVDKTPLWHLICNGQASSPVLKDMSQDDFMDFFEQLESCVVNPMVSDTNVLSNGQSHDVNWQIRSLSRQFYQPSVARSYSALLVSHHSSVNVMQGEDIWQAETEHALANDEGHDVVAEEIDTNALNMFNFPRGAHPGNFLHLLYETIEFHDDASPDKVIDGLSEQYLIEEKWRGCLLEHTALFMHKTLHPLNLSLSQLRPVQVKKEMGFHLMAKSTQGSEMSKILSQYRGGEGIESLNNMQGLFKGFIDLVFENQGQYYVLDYKSNHLGHSFSDYSDENMHLGMLDHNYDLQYLVYCTALHLFLLQRVTDYDYDSHMGGVFYIFLRGINKNDNAGIYFRKPPYSIINRLARFFESGKIPDLIAQASKRGLS